MLTSLGIKACSEGRPRLGSRLWLRSPEAGEGYTQSLPAFTQARHGVLTPLFKHLTLERLHLAQAMEERILGWSARLGGPASAGLLSRVAAARRSSTPFSAGWIDGSVTADVGTGRD